jgi:hypothetical protein
LLSADAELKRVQDEANAEINRVQGEVEPRLLSAKAELKRIEGERALVESMWRKQMEHYKRKVQLSYTHDYEPYKKAKEKSREKLTKKREEEERRRRE